MKPFFQEGITKRKILIFLGIFLVILFLTEIIFANKLIPEGEERKSPNTAERMAGFFISIALSIILSFGGYWSIKLFLDSPW